MHPGFGKLILQEQDGQLVGTLDGFAAVLANEEYVLNGMKIVPPVRLDNPRITTVQVEIVLSGTESAITLL